MSTRNYYPYQRIKKALQPDSFRRAIKHDKWGYAYTFWLNPHDVIWVLTDCHHKIINLECHNNADPHIFRSLQIHKTKGGKIDWSLAFKDVLL